MKRGLSLVGVFALVLSWSIPLLAAPDPIGKIKGGVMDILSSPMDLKDDTVNEVKGAHFKPLGLVGGLLKGSAHMVKKSVSGAVDIATFLVK